MNILSSLIMLAGLGLTNISQAQTQSNTIPCGLSGSIAERIQDCSLRTNSFTEKFQLVSVTSEGVEIYQDKQTTYLWSSRLPEEMGYKDAHDFCGHEFGKDLGFAETLWYLPQLVDYAQAKEDGMNAELPEMNTVFQTVTAPLSFIGNFKSYGYNGKSGVAVYLDYELDKASVRCMGMKIQK